MPKAKQVPAEEVAQVVEAPVEVVEVEEIAAAPVVEAVELVKVRVLAGCSLGQPDDVVEIDASLIDSLAGAVDAHPDAVAYAESLK